MPLLLILLACAGKPELPVDSEPTGGVDSEPPCLETWLFRDADGDGFGDPGSAEERCPEEGWVTAGEDCDDADAAASPAGAEVPLDGVDQDCDGADATQASCDTLHWIEGDLVLRGEADLIRACAAGNAVRGSLLVREVEEAALPLLACACVIGDALLVEDSPGLEVLSRGALVALGGGITLRDNPALADIAELPPAGFSGALALRELPAMQALPSWSGITELQGLQLEGLTGLTGLSGFDDLRWVRGDVSMEDLPAQASGLGVQVIEGALSVADSPSLQRLTLAALEEVGGDLLVRGVGALETLEAPSLRQVGGTLQLNGAGALQRLSGLAALEEVGGLRLLEVSSLETLGALTALRAIRGEVVIQDNARLTELGLPALELVDGDLYLVRNHALTLQEGPRGAWWIDGDLLILDNDGFVSVEALNTCHTIDGDLQLSGNAQVEALTGLYGVGWLGGDLEITRNEALTRAEAEALRDEIGESNIFGVVVIEENGG